MPTSMETGLLVIYALVVWWGATGLILLLNRRRERTYRSSLICAGMLAVAGLAAAIVTRDMDDITGAVVGFTGALSVWALIEMLFLMGVLVGTHREAARKNEIGWSRFKRASLAIAHHEAALVVTLGILVILFYGSANPTALWTFALLWFMRLSTKLNIFFGVPNTAAELLPPRISYLRSYFRTARPSGTSSRVCRRRCSHSPSHLSGYVIAGCHTNRGCSGVVAFDLCSSGADRAPHADRAVLEFRPLGVAHPSKCVSILKHRLPGAARAHALRE